METIITYQRIEDSPLGEGGLILEHLREAFNGDVTPINSGRLFFHDFIEHCERSSCHPCINELIALGALVHNRRMDYYNSYGDDGLSSDIGQMIVGLYNDDDFNVERIKLYTSRSDVILSEIDSPLWEDVLKYLKDDDDIILTKVESRRYRSLVYRSMARGYNRMLFYANKYNVHFDLWSHDIILCLEELIPQLQDALLNEYSIEGYRLQFQPSKRRLVLRPIWDEQGLDDETFDYCSENGISVDNDRAFRACRQRIRDGYPTQTINF